MTTTPPTDTTAALEAAIDDYGNATAREAMNADERAALHRAITAHVDAEIARRLACAPGVEEAMCGFEEAIRNRNRAGLLDVAANDAAIAAAADALRTAIAADRARAAVEATDDTDRAERFAAEICRRVGARDSGCGGQTVEAGFARLYADAAKRIDLMIARDKARPTPDEARRLVKDMIRAYTWPVGPPVEESQNQVAARTALLRALGVEA